MATVMKAFEVCWYPYLNTDIGGKSLLPVVFRMSELGLQAFPVQVLASHFYPLYSLVHYMYRGHEELGHFFSQGLTV